jgi:hypothetical protein
MLERTGEERPSRERRDSLTDGAGVQRRLRVRRYIRRAGLEPFERLLELLVVSHFGEEASVMPHLRRSGAGGRTLLVFVVDAARPDACADYPAFLELERSFWTVYAGIPKPAHHFAVAIRPSRDWVRVEALAPLFTYLPSPGDSA